MSPMSPPSSPMAVVTRPRVPGTSDSSRRSTSTYPVRGPVPAKVDPHMPASQVVRGYPGESWHVAGGGVDPIWLAPPPGLPAAAAAVARPVETGEPPGGLAAIVAAGGGGAFAWALDGPD